MHWIEAVAAWSGERPVALVTEAGDPERRRARLRALVARALGTPEEAVTIAHEAGRAPHLVPPARPLVLSSSSRAGLAALALAEGPVGIDVETVEGADPPWLVLHPAERAFLRALPAPARAAGFARLWSLKEAYAKALGTGLAREPSRFAVRFLDAERAAVEDPGAPARLVEAATRWHAAGGRRAAVSAVLLHPRPPLM